MEVEKDDETFSQNINTNARCERIGGGG